MEMVLLSDHWRPAQPRLETIHQPAPADHRPRQVPARPVPPALPLVDAKLSPPIRAELSAGPGRVSGQPRHDIYL